jgi:hypothetical protein
MTEMTEKRDRVGEEGERLAGESMMISQESLLEGKECRGH